MSEENKGKLSRRSFVKALAASGGLLATSSWANAVPLRFFNPQNIENPLAQYPDRDWEKIYRNIFANDSSFVFLCAPNDTHNCLLKAYVKNGVVTRIGPSYGYGKATDLYGNQSSHRWDPRICQKGLALVRRFYGDRRVKAPMIRRGFKEWADAGFPRDPATGSPDPKYFQRGKDKWLRTDWQQAYDYSAKAFENIASNYSGDKGEHFLHKQGYDPAMIEALEKSGTQTIKLRGGMAFLGATRIFGLYRFANMLALMDSKIRNVDSTKAIGARGWDSYSWHTDLPPGHPMVTGAQTNDFDLFAVERSKLLLVWGMNWITTKMPDSHWMTEARLKGTKTVAITVEYSATASKADDVVVIRPGTDPAFALGLAQQIISKKLYDKEFVETKTDLPFLVRLDTLKPLRPEDFIADFKEPTLQSMKFLKKGEKPLSGLEQRDQFAPESMKDDFKSFVVFDKKSKKMRPVSRDEYGNHFQGVEPELGYRGSVKLLDGKTVKVRSIFNLTEEYLNENMTPEKVELITGAPAKAVVSLAKEIAANKELTSFACGMGPNQFFNADLKDRAIFLVAALTRNVGFPGGNVGSYAGNYRAALIGGEPVYAAEDPFNLQLSKGGKVKVGKYSHYESLHYYNYGDRPLRVGDKLFTGNGHMPVPTKAMWLNNSNSVIGNVKWHYDVVHNTLPKIEFIAYSDWWWTGSCEYADIVFACDSWAEFKHPDMCGSCTNPFLQLYPETPMPRVFDTKADIEIIAGVSKSLAKVTGDSRMSDMWKFVYDNDTHEYLQRIIDASFTLKGYNIHDLEKKAKEGIPALMNNRTYPRVSSYEQAKSEMPWHTKSGRLEFYRHEPEFIEHGENMVVYREPVDSTPYEPNVIVAQGHEALRPKQPKEYGLSASDTSVETRQVRNVMKTAEELVQSKHPLKLKLYTHVYHTPKYRHGAHTTPVDTDMNAVWFGPFGDVYRHDKRMPAVVEGYVDINPLDGKALGVEDGDYVYVDADPSDRPYRNWKKGTEEYKISRLMLRARYYPGTPRGIARTWHNMYGATFGSVKGQETRQDGLAKSAETNYQAMYRGGSHQSATRAWLRPTLMTETLVHKTMFGQGLEKGFASDIHCPVGAPREAFVKITKAESGGVGGQGRWRPASLGFRPTYENQAMKEYLKGRFMKRKG
ncbi:molybdopterin-dependent oxidoreductase [Bdellovibrio sp.]|uniref:molybdopterin-dependent oxidoreductase n=1 Tax=Bdellovibrio sp. TaxID=28201 RepID=UPI0039E71D63